RLAADRDARRARDARRHAAARHRAARLRRATSARANRRAGTGRAARTVRRRTRHAPHVLIARAAERGGPFGRGPAAESSPLGGVRASRMRKLAVVLVMMVALAGIVTFGEGVYLIGKAELGQWL